MASTVCRAGHAQAKTTLLFDMNKNLACFSMRMLLVIGWSVTGGRRQRQLHARELHKM